MFILELAYVLVLLFLIFFRVCMYTYIYVGVCRSLWESVNMYVYAYVCWWGGCGRVHLVSMCMCLCLFMSLCLCVCSCIHEERVNTYMYAILDSRLDSCASSRICLHSNQTHTTPYQIHSFFFETAQLPSNDSAKRLRTCLEPNHPRGGCSPNSRGGFSRNVCSCFCTPVRRSPPYTLSK